jgi:hypothetical protein
MRFLPARLRARARRPRLLAVASAAVLVSAGIVLAPIGTAHAVNEPWYDQPAPDSQQLQAYSGNSQGQTAAPASYASVLCVGTTLTVSVNLDQTNQPGTAFQSHYMLDNDATWVTVGHTFMTDGTGSGWDGFTVDDMSPGVHQLALDINRVSGPGTFYVNQTRNHGGTIGIYFACPPAP